MGSLFSSVNGISDYDDSGMGGIGGLLGPGGLGVTGTSSSGQQTTTQDDVTRLLEALRYNESSNAMQGSGLFGQLYSALTEQQPLTSMDPEAAVGYGRNLYQQILSPAIAGQYSLMGLGRSGAQEEAQAKGAAQISLPIAQQALQQNQQAQQFQQNLHQQGLLGQLGALASILNQMPYATQPSTRTRGTGNTGVLTSYLGGNSAGGMAQMFGGGGAGGAAIA